MILRRCLHVAVPVCLIIVAQSVLGQSETDLKGNSHKTGYSKLYTKGQTSFSGPPVNEQWLPPSLRTSNQGSSHSWPDPTFDPNQIVFHAQPVATPDNATFWAENDNETTTIELEMEISGNDTDIGVTESPLNETQIVIPTLNGTDLANSTDEMESLGNSSISTTDATLEYENVTGGTDLDNSTDAMENTTSVEFEMTTGNATDIDNSTVESTTDYDNETMSTGDNTTATSSTDGLSFGENSTAIDNSTSAYMTTDNMLITDNNTLDLNETLIETTTDAGTNKSSTIDLEMTTGDNETDSTDNSTLILQTSTMTSENVTTDGDYNVTMASTSIELEMTTGDNETVSTTTESSVENITSETTLEITTGSVDNATDTSDNATTIAITGSVTTHLTMENTTDAYTVEMTTGLTTDNETSTSDNGTITGIVTDGASTTTESIEIMTSDGTTDATTMLITSETTMLTTEEETSGSTSQMSSAEITEAPTISIGTEETSTQSTSTGVQDMVDWKFKITDIDFDSEYVDKLSSKYGKLYGELKLELDDVFETVLPSFQSTNIKGFSKGSIVVTGETTANGPIGSDIGDKFYDEVVNKRKSLIGGHVVEPSSIEFNGAQVKAAGLVGKQNNAGMPGYMIGVIAALVVVAIVLAIIALIMFQQKRHRTHRLHDDDYMFDDDLGSEGPNGVAVKHWQSTNNSRSNGRDPYSGVNMFEMTENQSLQNRPPPRPQMPPPPKHAEVGLDGVVLETGDVAAQTNYGYQQEGRLEPTGILRVPIGTEDYETATSEH